MLHVAVERATTARTEEEIHAAETVGHTEIERRVQRAGDVRGGNRSLNLASRKRVTRKAHEKRDGESIFAERARRIVGQVGRLAGADVPGHDDERAVPRVALLQDGKELCETRVLLGECGVAENADAQPVVVNEAPAAARAARAKPAEHDASPARIDGSAVLVRFELLGFLARKVPGWMRSARVNHDEGVASRTLVEHPFEPGGGACERLARREVFHGRKRLENVPAGIEPERGETGRNARVHRRASTRFLGQARDCAKRRGKAQQRRFHGGGRAA